MRLNLTDIIEMRKNKISLREIAKKYNTNHVAVSKFLRENNESTEMFRHSFNHKFFDNINDEKNAYYLGMMMSDGFVQEGRTGLNLTDLDVIEKFKRDVEYDGKIRLVQPAKPHHKMRYEINLYSTYMTNILEEKYGIIQNKSLILDFPDKSLIPDHLMRHLIRGYFEGDGGFTYDSNRGNWNIVITGTREVLNGIDLYSPVKGYFDNSSDPESNTWRWVLRKQLDIIEFCEWIYHDNTVCMDRKYNRMLECVKDLKSRKLYMEKEKTGNKSPV
jgi:hypothetical protein